MRDTEPLQKMEPRQDQPVQTPAEQLISVIMANLNEQTHIREAIRSVLNQTHTRLELIISDDGSRDNSCDIIREEMTADPRIKLIETTKSRGPAGARNCAIAAASGDWIAIVDSDDIIHPERLARLIQSAVALQSDILADDIIYFGDDLVESNKTLLQELRLAGPERIHAVELISGCVRGAQNVSLGYLKPLIRRAALGDIRYNENLQIDEDYDLYLRLLLSGATFTLIPDAMYLYRRHAASASYRFDAAKLRLMIVAQNRFLHQLPQDRPDLSRAVAQRIRNTQAQLEYLHIINAISAGKARKSVGLLWHSPHCVPLLFQSLKERGTRRLRRQGASRQQMNIVLGLKGQARPSDYPDATLVYVPDVPDTGWLPSAADTWAHLAHLSCKNDLDIIALDRAGQYALGLVPRWHSARVLHADQITTTDPSKNVSYAEGT